LLGLITGISFLTKPEGLLIGVMFTIILIYDNDKFYLIKKHQLILLLLFISSFLLVTLLYTYVLYYRHDYLLPMITKFNLKNYVNQAGNTIIKYLRNFIDNTIFIWQYSFGYIYVIVFLTIIKYFKKTYNSKEVRVTLLFILGLLLLHSKAFGIHVFEQLNPIEALTRYSIVYIPYLLYLFYLSVNLIKSSLKPIIFIYVLLLILISIRNTIPISMYYPKGWTAKEVATSIKNNKLYNPDKPLISTQEVLSYLENKNGVSINYYKRFDKDDSEIFEYSKLLHTQVDTLEIKDLFGRKFKKANPFRNESLFN